MVEVIIPKTTSLKNVLSLGLIGEDLSIFMTFNEKTVELFRFENGCWSWVFEEQEK